MVKRKAEEDLPDTISLQPVIDASSPGMCAPFALYFASGFQPGEEDRAKWEVHTSNTRRNQHLLVARLVRMPWTLFSMQNARGWWKAPSRQ